MQVSFKVKIIATHMTNVSHVIYTEMYFCIITHDGNSVL